MSEIKVREFSYYNQKGELVVKGGYNIHREEDPYMINLLDQYSAGETFGTGTKAWDKVSSEEEIIEKINSGVNNIALSSNVVLSKSIEVKEGSVFLSLGNKTLSCPTSDVLVVTGGNLIISGNGTVFASEDNSSSACAVWAKENGNVTINGGIFKVGDDKSGEASGNWRNDCIYARDNATITINGGEFMYTGENPEGHKFLLNCRDVDYKAGKCNIIVKGGIFHNFDPANNVAEFENTNFVAEGYKSVTNDGGKTYKVVKA